MTGKDKYAWIMKDLYYSPEGVCSSLFYILH